MEREEEKPHIIQTTKSTISYKNKVPPVSGPLTNKKRKEKKKEKKTQRRYHSLYIYPFFPSLPVCLAFPSRFPTTTPVLLLPYLLPSTSTNLHPHPPHQMT